LRSVSASNGMKKKVTTATTTARATKRLSLQNLRKVPQKVARKKIRIPVLSIAAARRTPIKGALLEVGKKAREKELSEKNALCQKGRPL
jgi:hypothetical protein